MPKVSVIIPTYNSSRTIGETLQSVFGQTYSDFEILLINDGSTDNLMEVLKDFKDSRLQILHYKNGGLSAARNRGIDQASGEYLIFLDADDLWSSDKLESHVKALDNTCKTNSRAGIVYSWSYFLDDETSTCYLNHPKSYEGNVLPNILENNFVTSGSNPMITRKAIDSVGYFNDDFKGASDWEYWIRLAVKWDYILIPERQVFYRQSRTSMSSNVPKMEQDQLRVINAIFPSLPSNLQSIKPIALSNIYFYSAKLYSRQPPTPEIAVQLRQKLWQAIVTHPGHVQKSTTYLLWIKSWLFQILPHRWFQSIHIIYRQLKHPLRISPKVEL
jgi:glycosyltransferase involved in cell wall biosynthesis